MSTRLTVARALARLERARVAGACASATVTCEQRALRRLLPRLGRSLPRVERAHVEALLAQRLSEVAPASVARELSSLRALFRLLVRDGLLSADPTERLVVRVPERAQLVLTDDAVRALLEAASLPVPARRAPALVQAVALRNRAALELLFALGLRASELCRARAIDLELGAEPSLLVRRAKRAPAARLPLPPACVPHLSAYLRQARPVLLRLRDESAGCLLVSERGRPLTVNHLHRLVVHVARRAGLRAHPHALRRSLASGLVRAGASLPTVQALLGHRRLDTTQRYVHVDLDELRACVEPLDRREGGAANGYSAESSP